MLLSNTQWVDLSKLSDKEVEAVAKRFGLETTQIKKEQLVNVDPDTGVSHTTRRRFTVPINRFVLEERLDRVMRLEYYIPSDFWTKKQAELYQAKGIIRIKNGTQEALELEKLGILVILRDAPVEISDEIGQQILDKYNLVKVRTQDSQVSDKGRVVRTAKYDVEDRGLVKRVDINEWICQYCGESAANKAGLGLHEYNCGKNPDRILDKEKREARKAAEAEAKAKAKAEKAKA